jgi:O-antigen ligase
MKPNPSTFNDLIMPIATVNTQTETPGLFGLAKSVTVGGVGLCLFFLCFQLNTTAAYLGLLVITLVFAFQARMWMPLLKRDAVAWLFLFTVFYILFYSLWAAHEFPETAQAQRTALLNWIHWLYFIPVAWQLSRHWQPINKMLLILAAGLMIRILANLNWSDLGNILNWERTGFGMAEPVFAPIAGTTVLGFLVLAPRMTLGKPNVTKWSWLLRVSLWLTGLGIFLESLVLSQTRGVWLASAVVFPLALLFRYKRLLGNHAIVSIKNLFVLALIIGMAWLFLNKNYTTLINRVNSEQLRSAPEVVKKQFEGQEVLMTTSVGYRKILWEIGWRKWRERPIFGWGPGTTELLLKQEAHPLLSQSITLKDGSIQTLSLPHLHNLYLEFLVRFGLFGTLLILTMPMALLANLRKAQAKGIVPWDYACFLFAGWGLLAIMVFFDFQIFKYAWRNYCLIWAALTFAVQLENS